MACLNIYSRHIGLCVVRKPEQTNAGTEGVGWQEGAIYIYELVGPLLNPSTLLDGHRAEIRTA